MESHPKTDDDILKDTWMIRPCEIYKDEHHECTCAMGRFNQYYVLGKFNNCDSWWQDYKSCLSFRKTNSTEDARKIIAHEAERRLERLKNAKENDVWDYRQAPPPDWSSPLPDWVDRDRPRNVTKDSRTEINQQKMNGS